MVKTPEDMPTLFDDRADQSVTQPNPGAGIVFERIKYDPNAPKSEAAIDQGWDYVPEPKPEPRYRLEDPDLDAEWQAEQREKEAKARRLGSVLTAKVARSTQIANARAHEEATKRLRSETTPDRH